MRYNESMVQDSLVDYIASQVKLGVPRDSIKTALTGVGWAAQDVEDTLKKVEGGPAAAPSSATVSTVSAAKPMSVSTPAASQNIRVSDLVSATLTPPGSAKVSPASMGQNKMGGGSGPASASSSASAGMGGAAKKGMGKSAYFMIGLILILAGVSTYLYFQNSSLSSQVQTAGGASQGAAAQVTTLTGQVQALTASGTALTAQIANLTAQVAALQADLSFFMVPTGQAAGVPVAVTVSGTLSGSKLGYVLTTPEGVKVTIKNSANADVQAALQPLVAAPGTASAAPVQISGTHLPGVASVTVNAVNGQPVTKPVAAASSTMGAATSSAVVTSTTQQRPPEHFGLP